MKCSDEISIGEYVRTDKGIITKAQEHFIDGLLNGKSAFGKAVKHSKNIIDLIEEGDYVNGMELYEFDDDEGNLYLGFPVYDDALMNCIEEVRPLNTVEIKSIITKEQIKQIEFRIGD